MIEVKLIHTPDGKLKPENPFVPGTKVVIARPADTPELGNYGKEWIGRTATILEKAPHARRGETQLTVQFDYDPDGAGSRHIGKSCLDIIE